MRVFSVTYNNRFCMEGDSKERSCSFEFNRNSYGGLVSRQMLDEYSRVQRGEIHESDYDAKATDELHKISIPNIPAFKSDSFNLYFLLNNGHLRVQYTDGTKETITNPYTSPGWNDYKNVWTYDKECRVFLNQYAYFLWVTLIDVNREDNNIKVMTLKKEGDTPASYETMLTGENVLFMCGQNFNYNGDRYDEYKKEFTAESPTHLTSHLQCFSNVTNLSFSTESCASLVLIEKK